MSRRWDFRLMRRWVACVRSRDPMPAQQLIEGLCSLLGEEYSRPRQFDRGLRSWDRFGEPVRPFDRKVDIVHIVIERANETFQVSRTLLAAEMRPQVDFDV